MRDSELNWIDGDWCGATSGHTFEPELRRTREEPPCAFPRSGADDFLRALEVAGDAVSAWHARSSAERAGLLTGLLEELGGKRGPSAQEEPALTTALGLSPRAVAHERRTARRAGERILFEEGPPAAQPGVALARGRAGEAFVGALARALPALADGLAVVLLSDPCVPHFALEVARAADRAGLPPGVLALLHDDGESVLRAGLAHPGIACFRLSGSYAELARFRRDVTRRAADASRAGFGGRGAPFGAGVMDAPPARLELALIHSASRVVREHDSVERAAESVARAAFGRVEAFSGQRAGQVARVYCHELLFSEFTACLLEAIEEQHEREETLPLLDPELAGARERRVRLGLDEGATLVLGDSPAPSDSRRSRRDATLVPTVFTNAEPRMRLVQAARPAPVLCLLRTAGDEDAEAQADAMDEHLDAASGSDPAGDDPVGDDSVGDDSVGDDSVGDDAEAS